ncbi:MAG: N-acetyltransferase [Anaerolineales bacterium]|nr:N-acetyltransferase [Anaerolineales bacterium]
MKFSINHSGNREEIKQLFTKSFSESEGLSEGLLIGDLTYDLMTMTNPQDYYCFIATEKEQIVGSIFFSRLMFESGVNAFLLGPVAIHPSYQGKGIGQKLINFGLNTIQEDGIELVFTYGDPNFYIKVGFQPISEKLAKAPLKLKYPEGWLAQSLVSDEIKPIAGNSKCVEAIAKPEFW